MNSNSARVTFANNFLMNETTYSRRKGRNRGFATVNNSPAREDSQGSSGVFVSKGQSKFSEKLMHHYTETDNEFDNLSIFDKQALYFQNETPEIYKHLKVDPRTYKHELQKERQDRYENTMKDIYRRMKIDALQRTTQAGSRSNQKFFDFKMTLSHTERTKLDRKMREQEA